MKKLFEQKKSRDVQQQEDHLMIKKIKVSGLAAAVTSLICTAIPTSYASDIEIYTKPSSSAGSGVVVMMLDTSGSMDIDTLYNGGNYADKVRREACDLPSSAGSYTVIAKELATIGGYTRNYCQVLGAKKYYFKKNAPLFGSTKWYSCESGFSASNCNTLLTKAPAINDLTPESAFLSADTYYYKTEAVKYYDRISRLKDALYTLATMPVYDERTEEGRKGIKSDVKIGVGTYPYVSNNENNLRGYIRIPAAEWGAIGSSQRQAVLDLIKSPNFKGTGGTPTSAAYAEAAAYLLGTTTGGGTYSGINLSKSVNPSIVSGSNNYVSPLDKSPAAAECSGQGIYFLTDGQPQSPSATTTTSIMANALNLNSYTLSTGFSNNGANDGNGFKSDWQAIGSFSKSLNDVNVIKNALGVAEAKRQVLTAVVGFGSVFQGSSQDGQNATDWGLLKSEGGLYGQGGFIAATEPDQVVQSLNDFIGQVGGSIPSISTGSSTIPKDALNPEVVQGFSYFPQFEPKVADEDKQQTWFGNLKKYYVLNNSVYSNQAGGTSNVVSSQGVIRDLSDIWAKSGVSYAGNTAIYQKGGALSRLVLGTTTNEKNEKVTGRTLLTDYDYDSTKSGAEKEGRTYNLVQINHTYTKDEKTRTDIKYAKSLMAVLGYNIASTESTNGLDLTTRTADIRQLGSVLHSLPILLTQEGKLVAKDKDQGGRTVPVFIDSESREDYVLFGTAQGMVHVVDVESGNEKFTFLPKEILEKQAETLKQGGGNLVNGKNALYYGMDGEWTAHSVYVSKDDGTLTVKGVVRNIVGGTSADTENLQGKQWVYGGMRMGGRSYYALDLTDINNPKIKFHIDPSTGKVYSKANPSGKAFDAIKNMGQSWSKPKIDYVNWKGQRKLVMFVGGGYDAGGADGDGLFDANNVRTGYAGYEKFDYKQENSTSTKKTIGSGVYMFDADTGDLLWNAGSNSDANLISIDLKYSVASEIKTVDRNNDGIIDHLYFADLAGQAFRVDFKNDGGNTFTTQINKVLDLYNTNGKSPRFYLPPTFTAHKSAGMPEGGNIVVATFISGNKSSPLLATAESPTATGQINSTNLVSDAVYAIYDYDIFPDKAVFPVATKDLSLIEPRKLATGTTESNAQLKLITATTSANSNRGAIVSRSSGWGGWYYKFDKGIPVSTTTAPSRAAAIVKGLTPLIAIDGSLYVTMYDASEAGTTSKCGAGVKGKSFTKRLCLPTGVCKEDADYTYDLGAGIVSLNVGPSLTGGNTIVVPNPDEVCTGSGCSPCIGTACETGKKFLSVDGTMRFIPNRWYERYAKVDQVK